LKRLGSRTAPADYPSELAYTEHRRCSRFLVGAALLELGGHNGPAAGLFQQAALEPPAAEEHELPQARACATLLSSGQFAGTTTRGLCARPRAVNACPPFPARSDGPRRCLTTTMLITMTRRTSAPAGAPCSAGDSGASQLASSLARPRADGGQPDPDRFHSSMLTRIRRPLCHRGSECALPPGWGATAGETPAGRV